MKVLLTNFHPHGGGGHTTYLKYLYEEFTKLDNIEVYIACPQSSKLYRLSQQINENNLFAIDFPAKVKELSSVIKNTKKLAALIKKHNFDVIHVNGNPDHKMAMYCKIFYGLHFKIIRTKHDAKNIKENFFTKTQYDKYMDKMIVVSNFQYKQIDKEFIQRKTILIRNGVDLNYFSPRDKKTELLKEYRINENDLVFVSVAGTALYKGWQYLVEAASKLDKEQQKNVKIILAGNIPTKDVLEKYVNLYGMVDNVIFTGMLDDVRDVISLGDIGFVLSNNETISFACREMMAMAKPTVVLNYAGLPENVDSEINGWIVPYKDMKSIESIIKKLLLNRDIIDSFSQKALEKANNEFGLKEFINKILNVYEN